MTPEQLHHVLRFFPKSFFTVREIEALYTGKITNLPVTLMRLVKKGKLIRLMRGYYAVDLQKMNWEVFACTVKKPSYISLEYALYHHGLLDQVPQTITLVTTGKSAFLSSPAQSLEYSHIQEGLYFGYEILGNSLMAYKEKALLDELYLIVLGKRSLTIKPEWFDDLNFKRFQKWLKIFPSPVKRRITKMLLVYCTNANFVQALGDFCSKALP